MLLLLRIALAIFLLCGAIWMFAPRERVDMEYSFDPNSLGGDLEAYLARGEAQYSDITPGTEKRILWAGEAGQKTPLAVVYVHGFSATSEEIRPVPDRVAADLGANLFFARLSGHGRSGDAMAEPRAGDWIEDMAEAVAIGRRIGDEVIVIATSTGGTLSAIAATHPDLSQGVKGMVFVSPNFGINNPAALLLTLPLARHWMPLLAGRVRAFEPVNDAHEKFWTTRYPSAAVFPMSALVQHAVSQDYAGARVPALFLLSDDDRVVRPDLSRALAGQWGAGAQVRAYRMGAGDDPYAHVIAGDILSPGQTEKAVSDILQWVANL